MHIYGLDPAEQTTAATAASIARDVAMRHAADVDAQARFPREAMDALAEQGFLGLCVSKELGGREQGPRAFAAVVKRHGGDAYDKSFRSWR